MEAAGHTHHHEMPTSGRELDGVAISATLHCLTGCAIGEVAGIAIGTALGFSDLGTIALAVALAFLFGYTLTSMPLLRAGLALSVVIPVALASDTLSIATMEIVDNVIVLSIPGAHGRRPRRRAVLGVAVLRARGGRVVRVPRQPLADRARQGPRGGARDRDSRRPPVRVVAWVAAAAGVFGAVVLLAELF